MIITNIKNSLKNGCKVSPLEMNLLNSQTKYFLSKLFSLALESVQLSSVTLSQIILGSGEFLNFESSPRVNFNERISSSTDGKFGL